MNGIAAITAYIHEMLADDNRKGLSLRGVGTDRPLVRVAAGLAPADLRFSIHELKVFSF